MLVRLDLHTLPVRAFLLFVVIFLSLREDGFESVVIDQTR